MVHLVSLVQLAHLLHWVQLVLLDHLARQFHIVDLVF